MPDYTRSVCSVCNHPFRVEDDIVVCPYCGTPHHRSCFNREGHCVNEHLHTASFTWKAPIRRGDDDALLCGNCGEPNAAESTICRKCGKELIPLLPEPTCEQFIAVDDSVFYSEFSPYIGIDPESQISGLPAKHIAYFIGENASYYLSRFHFMRSQKTKYSWNWSALFFPLEWMLYRKLKKPFWIALFVYLLLTVPYLLSVMEAVMVGSVGFSGIFPFGINSSNLSALPLWAQVCLTFLPFAMLIFRFFIATFCNHTYQKHVVETISALRVQHTDPKEYVYALSAQGRTSRKQVIIFLIIFLILITAGSVFYTLK